MLELIKIKNFRSIEDAEINLAPITVFYGPTGAGKSTVLYALAALRNFILNPNQNADGFFNLGFQGLGGFEQCVFNHDVNRKLLISVTSRNGKDQTVKYSMTLTKNSVELSLESEAVELDSGSLDPISLRAEVSIPYQLNQSFSTTTGSGDLGFTINWNGITCNVVPNSPTQQTQKRTVEIATFLNRIVEEIRNVDIVPHKRGFFKAAYTTVPITNIPTSDDEVASLIINDPHMPAKIAIESDAIFNRDFRTITPPGTATVYLQTTDKKAKTPVYIVNDGFGVNQVIYILAKIFRSGFTTLLIEEPEVHLHPTVIRNLAIRLCEIMRDEQKQLIFTTHSEQFLIALLACVVKNELKASDLKCYQVEREKKSSKFEEQPVGENGQIEGGLASFLKAEMEDLDSFLKPGT